MKRTKQEHKLGHSILILCLVVTPLSLTGCKSWTDCQVTSRYPFPVELYDATNSHYRQQLLGIITPGTVLSVKFITVSHGGFYQFTVQKSHGKLIKQITVPSQTLNNSQTLIIGG